MPWITRGKQQYYYRRIPGHANKAYVGRGPAAELAAQCDGARRAERLETTRRSRADHARHRKLDLIVAKLDRLCNLMAQANLLAAGYHRHDRGPWRRRRQR